MSVGVLVALLSAFFSAGRESLRKYVATDFSSVEIGFIGQVYGAVLLFPFAAWIYLQNGFSLTPSLLFAAIISGGVVLSTTYIYIEAMRISDISVTEPLRQTTPIFVALLEPLILDIGVEMSIVGAAVLGGIGSYVMVSKGSMKEPIRNIKNKGALMALLVAFIFSIWAIASRFGATNTNPLLFTYLTYIISLAGFGVWKSRRSETIEIKNYFRKDMFALGTVTAASAVIGIYAYSLLSASEVTVIKQTSGIFGVLIGGRFFKETDIVRKIIGAIIIVSGVVLVAI